MCPRYATSCTNPSPKPPSTGFQTAWTRQDTQAPASPSRDPVVLFAVCGLAA
eukprot:XP_001700284.1 predicted protein [Chlamydomonas reinhardtii]